MPGYILMKTPGFLIVIMTEWSVLRLKQPHHVHACVLPNPLGARAYDDLSSQLGRTSSHKLGKNKEAAHELYLVSKAAAAKKGRRLHLRCFVMLDESEQV